MREPPRSISTGKSVENCSVSGSATRRSVFRRIGGSPSLPGARISVTSPVRITRAPLSSTRACSAFASICG
jgi:hypothetical protein